MAGGGGGDCDSKSKLTYRSMFYMQILLPMLAKLIGGSYSFERKTQNN